MPHSQPSLLPRSQPHSTSDNASLLNSPALLSAFAPLPPTFSFIQILPLPYSHSHQLTLSLTATEPSIAAFSASLHLFRCLKSPAHHSISVTLSFCPFFLSSLLVFHRRYRAEPPLYDFLNFPPSLSALGVHRCHFTQYTLSSVPLILTTPHYPPDKASSPSAAGAREEQVPQAASAAATELHRATRALLLVNANHYAAWAARRSLVSRLQRTREKELSLSSLILTKHPKSAQTWEYRRWLLSEDNVHSWAAGELALAQRLTHYYAKNYYAWTHRLWIMQALAERSAGETTDTRAAALHCLEAELEATAAWQRANLGDHCAYHHEQAVLALWLELKLGLERGAVLTQARAQAAILLRAAVDGAKGGDVTSNSATAAPDNVQDEVIARVQGRAQAAIEAAGRYAGHEALAAHLLALQPLLLAVSTVLQKKRSDLLGLAAQCREAAAAAAAVQSNLSHHSSETPESV